ncbi:alpha/beta fold hydrolase [Brevundimonas vesicularis]|uniref:alpha/beta fold hydrolase n=1 Tax=Brevundimonas vesicularis TaxID=41276 RepID=UPI0038D4CD12
MHTRQIQTDSLSLRVIEAGSGPLVVLVHGFPELAISWTAQIAVLARAGYRVVAPDMRGYGGSEKPEATEAYSIHHLVGDLVALVRALGEDQAVLVGHDWGAAVAWQAALMRPDLFRAVAALSVPFQPRRSKGPPTEVMAYQSRKAGLGDLYINRFQDPQAHLAFDAAPETALRKLFWSFDGSTAQSEQSTGFIPEGQDLLDTVRDEASLPSWLTADHFSAYVGTFAEGGFKAPFDWYRNIDRNWDLTAWLQDRKITVPALFMVGECDPTRHYAGAQEAGLKDWVPDLRGQVVVPGAGHWLQQERPDEVHQALIDFLRGV